MEHAEKALAEHVAQRLEALGTNAFAAERANGLPADAIRSILRGEKKSGTTLNKAKEVCDALGLEFYIGPKREVTAAPSTTVAGENFSTVARFDAAGAAGEGMINLDGPPIDHLAFSKRWLEQNGINAGDCVLINVSGDSMKPGIHDGDLVMIDRRKTAIRSGKIYVFRDGDSLRIKRLELVVGAAIILRSDSPDQERFPPEQRTGAAMNDISQNLVGEVVWSCHKW